MASGSPMRARVRGARGAAEERPRRHPGGNGERLNSAGLGCAGGPIDGDASRAPARRCQEQAQSCPQEPPSGGGGGGWRGRAQRRPRAVRRSMVLPEPRRRNRPAARGELCEHAAIRSSQPGGPESIQHDQLHVQLLFGFCVLQRRRLRGRQARRPSAVTELRAPQGGLVVHARRAGRRPEGYGAWGRRHLGQEDFLIWDHRRGLLRTVSEVLWRHRRRPQRLVDCGRHGPQLLLSVGEGAPIAVPARARLGVLMAQLRAPQVRLRLEVVGAVGERAPAAPAAFAAGHEELAQAGLRQDAVRGRRAADGDLGRAWSHGGGGPVVRSAHGSDGGGSRRVGEKTYRREARLRQRF
eukprot:CAMPEP_0170248348 /NCGR_PEP_ID=MMETSP0116_2-20130129/23968_1 /TAXON_ID=400756 /ORGANISM="Durinskia baltica, Strain CSIRO CS-38" /LENGTH=352 /DNA_ID=CAMNT_0010499239 /DNA_START=33 /DNA_END=1088 /DNA_ORIENTATION=+